MVGDIVVNLVNNPCYVRVSNYGGFNVRFILSYVDAQGYFITEISDTFQLGGTRRSDYPCNARNLKFAIEVEVAIGVFSIAYSTEFPTPGKNCYNISGVTVAPIVTEYQCPEYDSYMQVDCAGAFVTRFFMDYVNDKGETIKQASGAFTAGMARALYYPPTMQSVTLLIQIAEGIGVFLDIYKNTFTTPARRCFMTTGTVFSAKVKQFDCYE